MTLSKAFPLPQNLPGWGLIVVVFWTLVAAAEKSAYPPDHVGGVDCRCSYCWQNPMLAVPKAEKVKGPGGDVPSRRPDRPPAGVESNGDEFPVVVLSTGVASRGGACTGVPFGTIETCVVTAGTCVSGDLPFDVLVGHGPEEIRVATRSSRTLVVGRDPGKDLAVVALKKPLKFALPIGALSEVESSASKMEAGHVLTKSYSPFAWSRVEGQGGARAGWIPGSGSFDLRAAAPRLLSIAGRTSITPIASHRARLVQSFEQLGCK